MKYLVRVYLSTYTDVEIEADNERQAIEAVEKDSDTWNGALDLAENMAVQEGETEILSQSK